MSHPYDGQHPPDRGPDDAGRSRRHRRQESDDRQDHAAQEHRGGEYGPARTIREADTPTQVIDARAIRAATDGPTGPGGTRPAAKPRRRRTRKILLICLVVFALLCGTAGFAGWWYLQSFNKNVTRTDAFDGLVEAERPAKVDTKSMNILVLGSDSRDPDTSGSRADTIMVAHVTADRKTAQIVSIPRDSWVDIPKAPDGNGGAKGKINWAFAQGGLPLMIRMVESFTKIRIDNVIVIDFAGFKSVVDAVGGIDIDNDVTFTSYFNPNNVYKKGRIHLDGDLALEYARTRKTLTDGDFGRMRHQQMVVKGVLDKATSAGTIANPGKLTAFLESIAKTITTDKDFNLVSTAMDLRSISSSNITFLTSPNKGTGMVGDQSVVLVDTEKALALFAALQNDKGATLPPG
ncbi:transcriptional regulator [Longispora fulva]|uniref:LCP family protein required for cell wall assembly n=1 Tax=Longispora fulva TaxID=619741 RepID=A0A8J7GJ66_9ACTN|nr:LCP family protein [Longispora fulva]MBG6137737.1 LCP family protein required for cell wall assembly [Longispora fulva]GIG62107.1 transcriptional regulator [Longispora fulva]